MFRVHFNFMTAIFLNNKNEDLSNNPKASNINIFINFDKYKTTFSNRTIGISFTHVS